MTKIVIFDDDMHVLSTSRDRSMLIWDLKVRFLSPGSLVVWPEDEKEADKILHG